MTEPATTAPGSAWFAVPRLPGAVIYAVRYSCGHCRVYDHPGMWAYQVMRDWLMRDWPPVQASQTVVCLYCTMGTHGSLARTRVEKVYRL
jgi:hypothetical protein